ncbi:iron chelate uptake ABC transporter family permease subunit [Thiomicrospira sp. R3]|uniref:iron chelate uptake ABC transporter family permease subunit n=1 Tax=Thiomicrospira sp. R3 TaxID=3035472 RepID=UPI00259B6C48|nr:iron chelate uptake ABC transporter family permease subunit [Thiomicrospira sp. R3]WFE67801.1 iron chelate uptake ABC transporter family permease subunit [Thiomicrospira sp. R3]
MAIDHFMLLALAGGLLAAWLAAPLGVFVVWQRQAYFGETLAHSALLGIGLGLMLQLNLTLAIVITSFLIVFGLHSLQRNAQLASDTLLGILAHGALATGLVALSLQGNIQLDILGYLFGDILSIHPSDLIWMLVIGLLLIGFFSRHWHDLLNITLNSELAQVEGVEVKRLQLQMTLLLALVIAVAMKIVGVLLITSLLILPAASARRLARTPEQMLGYSFILATISVLIGLTLSYYADLPSGPAIVVSALGLFLLLLFKKQT